jgi:hypothetical protein
MTADNVSREIAALLKQREQYRAFLVKLEERAGEANPRAYETVKQDYESKLKALGAKLVKHVEAVRQALVDSEAAVTDLEVRRDAKHEELEEARLRHSVGEYGDDKEWRSVERKLTKEFDDFEKQIEQKKATVANLQEVLEQIEAESRGRPAPEPKAKAAPKPAPELEVDTTAITGEPKEKQRRVRTPGQQVTETPVHGVDVGHLDELDLAAAPPARADAGTDELKFLESLSLTPGPDADEETPSSEVASAKPGPLSFLSKKAKGRTETIICPRCSAANDPAEWYCVECGEELPAG